jgi:nondiscriminating glutamyl-tRNA synthetase
MDNKIRVRFAPSPTGLLHLGSVRIALFNYLFAKQKDGTFILRIEDTDPKRNFDPGAKIILEDLAWLNLAFDEGPHIGGPYGPYFQSERSALYQEKLDELIKKDSVYRCFCTAEELEKTRARQIALKKPPRYDRTCLTLNQEEINQKLKDTIPFIWRFKVDTNKIVEINDLVRGKIDFDLSNFSDFPLTRKDGSFTFIFANAIDDIIMKVTHVFRGEDHISNTPCQALIYEVFNVALPIFWHMPIICNVEGKKLSKRDFGFSLQDLKNAGFLPEAICNYLAIIGASYENEIMSLDDLIKKIDFSTIHSTSAIKYDVEKLKWVNHQWLMKLPAEQLLDKIMPFLKDRYPRAQQLDHATLLQLIKAIQPELKTLNDAARLLAFYFEKPQVEISDLLQHTSKEELQTILEIVKNNLELTNKPDEFFNSVKKAAKDQNIPMKLIWQIVRIILTGMPQGPGIKELLELLGADEAQNRIKLVLQ